MSELERGYLGRGRRRLELSDDVVKSDNEQEWGSHTLLLAGCRHNRGWGKLVRIPQISSLVYIICIITINQIEISSSLPLSHLSSISVSLSTVSVRSRKSNRHADLAREIAHALPPFPNSLLPQTDFAISTTDSQDVAREGPRDSPDCIGEMGVFVWCIGE